jgi:hypothetical protein
MTHLDIYNISYGKKKGQESNWQFDSQPRKVQMRPEFCVCGDVQHTIGKLLIITTTLLETLSRLEV